MPFLCAVLVALLSQSGDLRMNCWSTDHILTMQQSLTYFERVLSHSHPAYISFLNASSAEAKLGAGVAIVWFTSVSIGTYCMLIIVGESALN